MCMTFIDFDEYFLKKYFHIEVKIWLIFFNMNDL